MAFKNIVSDDQYVNKLLSVIEKFKAVSSTLGPGGRPVIIDTDEMGGRPRCTKDGVTVAKSIELEDESENAIAKIVAEASKTLNTKQGDGTTSCIVFLQELIRNCIHDVRMNDKTNVSEYFKGMDEAMRQIIEYIHANTLSIKGEKNKIKQIAMIASNGDEKHSEFITQAYEKIGKYGSISCHESHGNESTLEIVEGMSLDRGYISNYFVNKRDRMVCELENAYILLYNGKISSSRSIIKALDDCAKQGKCLLIVAEDVDGEALTTLAINNMRGTIKVCAIKAPGFGDRRKDILDDIAIMTGGNVVSPDKGDVIDNIEQWSQYFGGAKIVTIDKDNTVIMNGLGDKDSIRERIMMIDQQRKLSTSEYDSEKLFERMSKLSDGIAKISVAAPTETEMREIKDRVEDAIHATKAAIDHGIVIGAGLCIAKGAMSIKIDNKQHEDLIKGMKSVIRSANSILRQILDNAYISSPEVVIHNILNHKDKNYGYNVRTNEYGDMCNMGVINASKIDENVVSIGLSTAKLLLSSRAIITDQKKDAEQSMPQNNHMGY